MNKIEEIKFGILTESELFFLEQKVKRETERRKTKPEEYIKVIRAEDGSEGFYVIAEDFHKIKSEELHEYIAQTLSFGSSITFSLEEYEKKDYEENGKRYEWNFGKYDDNNLNQDDDEE